MGTYSLTIADRIWNRSCLEDVSNLRDGDRALAAMILADGLTWNGGVLHAVESLDHGRRFDEATEAFRYFGRSDIAEFLIEARGIYLVGENFGEYEQILDNRYWALLPDHSADLITRFEAVLLANPSAFAPLSDQ